MHTIIIFLPLVLLITLALATKRMAESMFAAALAAMLILHGRNFLSGSIDSFYQVMDNSSFQFVIFILIGFGGSMQLLQDSGALKGFGKLVSRFASGQKKPLFLCFFLSVLMFVEDFVSILAMTFSMSGVFDQNRIPREHLAVVSVAVPASICILIPFSSWTAFTAGLLKNYDLGFAEYAGSIRYMFYPMASILIMVLLAAGLLPKVGELKAAYDRVAAGGPTRLKEENMESLVEFQIDPDQKPSSALNALIPIALIVVGTLVFDKDVIHGIFLSLLSEFLLFIPQRIMTVADFFKSFFEGAKGMLTVAILVFLGFLLSDANQAMGVFEVMIGAVAGNVPVQILPLTVFLIMFFTTFATAGCWVMQIIAVPIFIPMAFAVGCPPELIIAPMMSGAVMGYNTCFYADAIFLCAAGSGVANLRIIKCLAPYAVAAGVISAAAFAVLGFIVL